MGTDIERSASLADFPARPRTAPSGRRPQARRRLLPALLIL